MYSVYYPNCRVTAVYYALLNTYLKRFKLYGIKSDTQIFNPIYNEGKTRL